MLLLLSNCVVLNEVGGIVFEGGWAEGRGVGLPVMSRFLKLSTSKDALLLPRAALSDVVRSPLLPASSDASVLENGLAGAALGERVI